MTDLFHSTDAGQNWEVVPFTQFRTFPESKIEFTGDPNILYSIHNDFGPDLRQPVKSVNGGLTWNILSGDPTEGEVWSLFADPNHTERILLSGYSRMYFSGDGGNSFTEVYNTNDFYIAGVFWSGNTILVGTRIGMLVSQDGGQSFEISENGLPENYGMLSFSGAQSGAEIRLFCVAREGSIYPGMQGSEYWADQQIFRLDYSSGGGWVVMESGIPAEAFPFFVSLASNDINTVYVAGASGYPNAPMVYKSVNGGQDWINVFKTQNNENIQTGWMGHQGDLNWGWAENAMGFSVCPSDANKAIITDFGFAHLTENGGQTWRALYTNVADLNAANTSTPNGINYQSNGLENTSCWWLTWTSSTDIFASYTDITGIKSTDSGQSWSFNYNGNDYNSTYQVIHHEGQQKLYAAVSSVHDLYQSTYLRDAQIDGGTGAVLYSDDNGNNWDILHDFDHPVVWVVSDPANPEVLYTSVVHSTEGGIYKTTNLSAGSGASWVKLTDPPRTEGHPFNIHVLDDGTLVCSYSGRRAPGFTASSGVFVSTNGGQSWEDRSDSGMLYWTKDLLIDPHDADQNTWYTSVFSGWGGAANGLGGIYKTTNRGLSWERISTLDRVESVTIHPEKPDEMYVCTEFQGLWFTNNLQADTPSFDRVESYPFQHPLRVFFNPYNSAEIWVTSFGNGLRMGQELVDSYDIYMDVEALKLSLYPNPASDFIQVRLDAGAEYVSTISLLDLNGKVLKEKIWKLVKGPNAIQFPLDKYPAGRYEVILWLEGEVYTKAFVKK